MTEQSAPASLYAAAKRLIAFGVLLVLGTLVFGHLMVRAWPVLQLFIISILIAMAINPMVNWLEGRGVTRALSVLLMVLLVFTVVGTALWWLLPKLAVQASAFAQSVPGTLSETRERLEELTRRLPGVKLADVLGRVQAGLSAGAATAASRTAAILSAGANAVAQTFLCLFLVVMVLLDPRPLVGGLIGLFPPSWTAEVTRVGGLCVEKVQGWMQGTLILGLVMGTWAAVGLSFLGVEYALLWGVLSGLLELIPTLGPLLSAIPPVLVALSQEPSLAVKVIAMYTVGNMLENYALVPLVMGNKLKLHPVTLIVFMTLMSKLFGIFGAVMAMPTAAVAKVLYQEVYYRRIHGDLPPEPEPPKPASSKWRWSFGRKRTEAVVPDGSD